MSSPVERLSYRPFKPGDLMPSPIAFDPIIEPASIDNLDELARIIRTMTYDEMITLRSESGIDVRKLYGWSMK